MAERTRSARAEGPLRPWRAWVVSPTALFANERFFIVVSLMPTIVLIGVYIYGPILYSIYLSFFKTTMLAPTRFVGLQKYVDVVTDPLFWTSLTNTLYYSVGSVVLTLVLGLAVALLLFERLPGRDLVRTAMFVPYIIPYAAYALLWLWLFDPHYGLVNYLLGFVHINPIAWLKSRSWVIPAFILMSVWKRVGFAMIVFLAGLQTIPTELYDSARIDGANRWQAFRHITLPMLSPVTLFTAVISLIYSLQLFVEPLVMTNGGPGNSSFSLGYMLYQQGFAYNDVGGASVTAVILCALTFLISFILLRRFDIRELYK